MYPSNSCLTSVLLSKAFGNYPKNQIGHMAYRFKGGKEMYFLYKKSVLGNSLRSSWDLL